MCVMQFLRGYTILLADPVVASINHLDSSQRAEYLCDMTLIGMPCWKLPVHTASIMASWEIPPPSCLPTSSYVT